MYEGLGGSAHLDGNGAAVEAGEVYSPKRALPQQLPQLQVLEWHAAGRRVAASHHRLHPATVQHRLCAWTTTEQDQLRLKSRRPDVWPCTALSMSLPRRWGRGRG